MFALLDGGEMRNFSPVLIFVSFLGQTRGESTTVGGECEGGWVELSGRCYRLVSERTTWTEAVDRCRVMGAEMLGALTANEKEPEILELLSGESREPDGWWVGLKIEEIADTNWVLTVQNGVMVLSLTHRNVCGTVQLSGGHVQRSLSVCTSARPYICEARSNKRDNLTAYDVTTSGARSMSTEPGWHEVNSTLWTANGLGTQITGDWSRISVSSAATADVNYTATLSSAATVDVNYTTALSSAASVDVNYTTALSSASDVYVNSTARSSAAASAENIQHGGAWTDLPLTTTAAGSTPYPFFIPPPPDFTTESPTLTRQTTSTDRSTPMTPLRVDTNDAPAVTSGTYAPARSAPTDEAQDWNITRDTTISDFTTAVSGTVAANITEEITLPMSFSDNTSQSILSLITSTDDITNSTKASMPVTDQLPITTESLIPSMFVNDTSYSTMPSISVTDDTSVGPVSSASFTEDTSVGPVSSASFTDDTSVGPVSSASFTDDTSVGPVSSTSFTEDTSVGPVSSASFTDDTSVGPVSSASFTDDTSVGPVSSASFTEDTSVSALFSKPITDDITDSTLSTASITDDITDSILSTVSITDDTTDSKLSSAATPFTDDISESMTQPSLLTDVISANTPTLASPTDVTSANTPTLTSHTDVISESTAALTSSADVTSESTVLPTSSSDGSSAVPVSMMPLAESSTSKTTSMTSFNISSNDDSLTMTSPPDVNTKFGDDTFSGSDEDPTTSASDIFDQSTFATSQSAGWGAEIRSYNGCYVTVNESDAASFVSEARRLYKVGRSSCPALQVDSLMWPETPAGQLATLRCPQSEGFASWKCDVNVTCWMGSPDVTECVVEEINLKLQSAKLTGQEFNEYVTAVVARFLKISGDRLNSTETLKDAIETIGHIGNLTLNYQLTEKTFKTLLDFADQVISTDHQLWDKLNAESLRPNTDLLRGLEQITTDILSSEEAFDPMLVKDNIVIQRGEVYDDIYFPPRAKGRSLTVQGHSLYLPYRALGKAFRDVRYVVYDIRNENNRFKIGKDNLMRGDTVADGGYTTDIIAMTVMHHDGSLLSNVTLMYSVNQTDDNTAMCVFLNTSHSRKNVWSTEGCTQKWISESQLVCKCNHLTNFAVFMSLQQTPHTDRALTILSSVGCVVSILCLVLTLVVYCVLWRYLKSEKSTLLVHLCICLFTGYTIFLAGINRTDNKVVCTVIAALLHFCFLTVFLNFFCQGVALLVSVRSMTSRSFLKHYLVLIYVVPLVVVVTTLAVTGFKGHGTSHHCWLSTDQGVIWSFVGPAHFVLAMNILVLIVVIQSIQSSYGMMDKSVRARSISVARTLCFLTPIFGLSWVFGVLSLSSEEKVFQYLFVLFNSSQGLLIFVLQCLVRKQVREGFVKLRRQIRSRNLTSTSKTVSTDSNVKRGAEATL